MSTYFGGPKTPLDKANLDERHEGYIEQARKDHAADEVKPSWWRRLIEAFRPRSEGSR